MNRSGDYTNMLRWREQEATMIDDGQEYPIDRIEQKVDLILQGVYALCNSVPGSSVPDKWLQEVKKIIKP